MVKVKVLGEKGKLGMVPNPLLRSGRHEKWWVAHRDSYYRELKWFHEPFLCFFDKALWESVKGVSMPQKCKVLNSRSWSCIWIRTTIYIQSCTYFLIWYSRDGIFMWFLTTGKEWCCRRWKWYFEKEEWLCFFLSEEFSRELNSMHWYTPIMTIVFVLCKRCTSPIPSKMRKISFSDIWD